jgi:hypothetical protein
MNAATHTEPSLRGGRITIDDSLPAVRLEPVSGSSPMILNANLSTIAPVPSLEAICQDLLTDL